MLTLSTSTTTIPISNPNGKDFLVHMIDNLKFKMLPIQEDAQEEHDKCGVGVECSPKYGKRVEPLKVSEDEL
jgi:hypothetical protein